jgi:predicted porin
MTSNGALASPLMDYSAGKGSIDLMWQDTRSTMSLSGMSVGFDRKINLDASVTFGMGNNFAVQYRDFSPESDGLYISDPLNGSTVATAKLKDSELNILYKLNKNVAVFAGMAKVKGTIGQSHSTGYYVDAAISSDTKQCFQVGMVGSTQVADKTTLWGSVGTGSKITNWEIGAGYEFAPNWEFNINYRKLKAQDLRYTPPFGPSMIADNTAEGFGLGVTYKF